jgi:hypothetical protein
MNMVDKIKNGSFVQWNNEVFGKMYGVFLKFKDASYAVSFEEGFPNPIDTLEEEDQITLVEDKNLVVANLGGIATSLVRRSEDELFTRGDDTQSFLRSAFISRQADYLFKLIEAFKEIDDSKTIARLVKTPDNVGTGTGVYVARGEYSGQGRSNHFAGLSISPRLSEQKASDYLYKKYSKGFHTIPGEVFHTVSTSHGDLAAYSVLEIPQSKVEIVKISEEIKF